MQWIIPKTEIDKQYLTYGDFQKEYKIRREYCQKIRSIGKQLELSNKLITLCQIIFNRYYLYIPINNETNISYMISSIFFLCMKLEDCRTTDVNALKAVCTEQFKNIQTFNDNELYISERRLLVGINFDLNIETPHYYFEKFFMLFKLDMKMKLSSIAFINDLCSTHITLTHSAFTIALLAICFASKREKVELKYELNVFLTNCNQCQLMFPEKYRNEEYQKQHAHDLLFFIEFFEIQSDYVLEANQALNALYHK